MILAKGSSPSAPVTLTNAPAQPVYMVDRVEGPEQRRLCEMGFVEGARVSVVNRAPGMLVVKVGDSRLALARGMADNVWVK